MNSYAPSLVASTAIATVAWPDIIIIGICLLNDIPALAEKNDCSGMKKLSKQYILCTAENIKKTANKKNQQIKEGSAKKTKQVTEGAKKLIDNVKNKIKK
mgnify:CR=1 FL=1